MSARKVTKSTGESGEAAESFANATALPDGWTWARLGDVCKTTSGGTPSRKNAEHFAGDIPWVKSGELPDGLVTEVEEREADFSAVELVDIHAHPDVLMNVTEVLNKVNEASIHFPWSAIKNNLHACLFLVSLRDITIRPLVAPTHTHESFIGTTQRIYMSATLGGEGDLLRGYGIPSVHTIRAKHAQWGRRYIFMPSLYFDEEKCPQVIASIWKNIDVHRGLILAPSFPIADGAFKAVAEDMSPKPSKLTAKDIENSLDLFVKAKDVMLCLAGRYDGLDLPGDDCRLLIMADSPGAVGALERHLREHWKLGPLLRRRERTRLIQGMGRCTRDATDFAVIILLGQSLVDAVTPPVLAQKYPGEIQRELLWGMEQGEVAREDAGDLTEMIAGLLTDEEYRKDANENIAALNIPDQKLDELGDDESGKSEVLYLRSLWGGDYSSAYQTARRAADDTNGPDLAGYRAWWLFLASIVAHLLDDKYGEIYCLRRAKGVGINSGFLDVLLRLRSKNASIIEATNSLDMQAEAIWNRIVTWGWQGPAFGKRMQEMLLGLSMPTDYTKFHIGLERLGQCLGAEVIRSTADGAPDVVWMFHDGCFTFEAKAGVNLSKKYVLQAKGHADWVKNQRPELKETHIQPLVVSPENKVDALAKPHVKGLNFISVVDIAGYAQTVAKGMQELRTQFAGREYGAVRDQMKVAIRQAGFDRKAVDKLLSSPLLQE